MKDVPAAVKKPSPSLSEYSFATSWANAVLDMSRTVSAARTAKGARHREGCAEAIVSSSPEICRRLIEKVARGVPEGRHRRGFADSNRRCCASPLRNADAFPKISGRRTCPYTFRHAARDA